MIDASTVEDDDEEDSEDEDDEDDEDEEAGADSDVEDEAEEGSRAAGLSTARSVAGGGGVRQACKRKL